MPNKQPTILVATGIYPPDIGGPATYSKLLADELPARGFAVKILSFGEVRHLPKLVRHLVYFFKVLKRGRLANLIYAQDPVSVGLPAVIAAKLLGKKFMIRIAGDYAWEQSTQRFGVAEGIDDFQTKKYGWRVELLRGIQSWVAARADQIITPSNYFSHLVAGWIGGQEHRVRTIYNGIKLEQTAPEERKKIILTAGRLVPWKGFDFLIELMNSLPLWQLQIVGDGPDREKLERLIKDNHLADRVFLLGSVPREELLALLNRASLFVLNTTFESFSFQVVEALNAGLPVITTNIGNLAEIVTDGQDGFLVEPNNRQQFLEKIKLLETDHDLYQRLTTAGREKAKQFSIERTLDSLEQELKKLIYD